MQPQGNTLWDFRRQWVTVATSLSVGFHVGHIVCEMRNRLHREKVVSCKWWHVCRQAKILLTQFYKGTHKNTVHTHIHATYTLPAYGMRQVYAWVAELAACTLRLGFGGDVCACLCRVSCVCVSCSYFKPANHRTESLWWALSPLWISQGCVFVCEKWQGGYWLP